MKKNSENSPAEGLRQFRDLLKGFRPFDDRSRAIWEEYGAGREEKRRKETRDLEAIPGMKKSIIKGMKTPVKKFQRKLDW